MTEARATGIFNLHFDVVHGCQLRCVGCPNSTLLPKIKRIAVEDFARCLANIDVEHVHTLRLFNFGEPLLHKELSRLMAEIPRAPFRTSIVEISTNAQHVYWDDFERMLKLERLNRLVVSCDGDGTPADYERLRPPSKWAQLIEFLERARALRDRWSPALQLVTRTVCEVPEHRERWRKVLVPRGWKPEFRRWMILPESEKNMTAREAKAPPGVCFFLANANQFKNHPWHGQINLLYVDWDGTVVPCCMHPQAAVLGNLREQRYNDILLGRKRADLVAQMEKDRASMPVCGECEVGPVGNEGPAFASAMDLEDA
jgi:radical SAM protein with 4Fe4S-binding SPASM domain